MTVLWQVKIQIKNKAELVCLIIESIWMKPQDLTTKVSGITKLKRLPFPTVLSIFKKLSWWLSACFTIAKPKPDPLSFGWQYFHRFLGSTGDWIVTRRWLAVSPVNVKWSLCIGRSHIILACKLPQCVFVALGVYCCFDFSLISIRVDDPFNISI